MNLILDEWLWADLSGENGVEKQLESCRFIIAIYEICDCIIQVRNSQFEAKALKFLKHNDIQRRKIAKFFAANFLFNSKKSIPLEQDHCETLPDSLAEVIDCADAYIVRAHITRPDSIIITTDTSLMDNCLKNSISCQHRDEFVHDYLSKFKGT